MAGQGLGKERKEAVRPRLGMKHFMQKWQLEQGLSDVNAHGVHERERYRQHDPASV